MGRNTNIEITYKGLLNFKARVLNEIDQNKAPPIHKYHLVCNGGIGNKDWCLKCNRLVEREEIGKRSEIAGSITNIAKESIAELKIPAGIVMTGLVDATPIPDRQVKGVYALYPSGDKKTGGDDETRYESFANTIADGLHHYKVRAKLSSLGYKKGADLGVIRYNKEFNIIELVELYYNEELTQLEPRAKSKLISDGQLAEAKAMLLSIIKKGTLEEEKETQTDRIMQLIEANSNKQVGEVGSVKVGSVKVSEANQFLEALNSLKGV